MPAPSRLLLTLLLSTFALLLSAQQTFPQPAPSDVRPGVFAFTNATLFSDYKTRIDNATLVVRDGRVMAAGANVPVPKDAVTTDLKGQYVYPAFIDLYATDYGLPAAAAQDAGRRGGGNRGPQALSGKKGVFSWNESLRPEYNAADNYSNAAGADEWRKLGFGAVVTHRADGISRGTGALVLLSDRREHENMLRDRAAHFLSLRKGTSTQDYPSSLMGVIALLRQTYLDAQWYKTAGFKTEKNLSIEAWNGVQPLPQIFEATDKLDVLRVARLAREFGASYIVKTAGDEYQRLDDVKATGQALIVPLVFPEPYDLRDAFDALSVSLRELKHWEMAPSNPARLDAAGVAFALTTAGLRDRSKFWDNLRRAVEAGLSTEAALKALTWQPAQLIGATDQLGSLQAGRWANFIIASGDLFDKNTKIRQTWVRGQVYDIAPDRRVPSLAGTYRLEIGRDAYGLTVKEKEESPETYLQRNDSSRINARLSYAHGLVNLSFQADTAAKNTVILSGVAGEGEWSGLVQLPDGTWAPWRAVRTPVAAPSGAGPVAAPSGAGKPEPEASKAPTSTPATKVAATGDLLYPFTSFGRLARPKTNQPYLIRNATVWTNEKDGILQNTDVLLSGGKIARIGRNLPVPDNAITVDGTGKHLTAGIIDEHSHIAVARSVNEGTQESSAEVRIGDALDSEDVDIYRQLSGGVTASHLLHGSANPIGGQTQLIKLRWGAAPEELKFQNWPGQIKFALGENVKQSNWGEAFTVRYPQTRMGVEQVYVDYFTRAREYAAKQKSGQPYRRDLDLEALLEILEGKRFITCHSYVQSEITMLMRVAERFGFRVNTFTHILEGYKVADKMQQHGAGASTFSDWWAYKFEVYEAIPYNAKMMADRGVTVAINSDDAEMARRLNQEAAKAVLYGGMREEDAWKMVTLNPAKLLHVDDRVGSIRTGKDADVVLWSDNPLSIYARAERTWVDGTLQFDRDEDARLRQYVQQERARLVQKMMSAKRGDGSGERPAQARRRHYHCDSDMDEG